MYLRILWLILLSCFLMAEDMYIGATFGRSYMTSKANLGVSGPSAPPATGSGGSGGAATTDDFETKVSRGSQESKESDIKFGMIVGKYFGRNERLYISYDKATFKNTYDYAEDSDINPMSEYYMFDVKLEDKASFLTINNDYLFDNGFSSTIPFFGIGIGLAMHDIVTNSRHKVTAAAPASGGGTPATGPTGYTQVMGSTQKAYGLAVVPRIGVDYMLDDHLSFQVVGRYIYDTTKTDSVYGIINHVASGGTGGGGATEADIRTVNLKWKANSYVDISLGMIYRM